MGSSPNPYESPGQWTPPYEGPPEFTYRTADVLVRWLTVLLVANIVFDLLLGAAGAAEATVYVDALVEDDFQQPGAMPFYLAYGCLGLLSFSVMIATVVLFCMWIYRANQNARALGAVGMVNSPGWCVGWFFIPLMNLFKPYLATREIYKASDPMAGPEDWRSAPGSFMLWLWWAIWLITGVVNWATFRMSLADDAAVLIAGAWATCLAGLLGLPTALLAIWVVRTIHSRQEAKAVA